LYINFDGRTVTDPALIAEKFNKFFVNIASEIEKTIPHSDDCSNLYLNQQPF
jgi:hypothetical protein